MKTPILETSRLWLKPLKEEDAPGAFLWTGDPKVSWYMRYETHGSLEDTKQWLREEEKQLESDLLYDFGFHKKDSDELIGSGGLTFNQKQGIWAATCVGIAGTRAMGPKRQRRFYHLRKIRCTSTA